MVAALFEARAQTVAGQRVAVHLPGGVEDVFDEHAQVEPLRRCERSPEVEQGRPGRAEAGTPAAAGRDGPGGRGVGPHLRGRRRPARTRAPGALIATLQAR